MWKKSISGKDYLRYYYRPMNMQENSPTAPIKPLWDALHQKVLPWAADTGGARCLVAASTLSEFLEYNEPLPTGITATAAPKLGPRTRVSKADQRVGGLMAISHWREDGLLSKRELQIACVLQGRSSFRTGQCLLELPAGTFVLIPPGVPHPDGLHSHSLPHEQCDILWLTLYDHVLRYWMCHSQGTEHLLARYNASCFVNDPMAIQLFQILKQEVSEKETGYRQSCLGLMLALWTIIHRRLHNGQFFQSIFAVTLKDILHHTDSPIIQAQEYIRSHLHKRLTIADVAKRVYLSRAQFARRFPRETGATFTEFLTQCRLQEAQRLLLETTWPISTISSATGLTPAHLRNIFLKHTRQTPNEFRAHATGKNK